MSRTALALREIHKVQRQISDVTSRLQRGPMQVKALEAHLQGLQSQCNAESELLKKTRMSADEKQLQLREREDRIKDLQGKLNACSSNREYQTLREQIAADEQANSVLSDEILEALEAIDQQEIVMDQHEKQRAKASADLDKLRTEVEQQQVELKAQLEQAAQALERAENDLPLEVRTDYKRIARVRGQDALAQVDSETCSGCFQVLSPQTMNILMMGKTLFCSSCGALLYLPEDSPAS